MPKRHSKPEFLALLTFLVVTGLVLANGFVARISAQGKEDIYAKTESIAQVLDIILREYVVDPNVDKLVEGALTGMMNSLDRHSSFISKEALRHLKEDTQGRFEGIGVQIRFDDDKNIVVFQPLADSPAAKAGVLSGDIILKVDGVPASGLSLDEVATRIRGPRDTIVKLTIYRKREEGDPEIREYSIKRGIVPLESVKEARVLDKNIGYLRISDFKDTTAKDAAKNLRQLLDQGVTSLVLDLRWNPGGLLTASKQMCGVFLPKNTLVTYTQGRKTNRVSASEDMRLYTDDETPVVPAGFPIIVLVNDATASSAEIVTGALQFWKRAIVIGQKTYGKGSVQTIIPLAQPSESALRLTTALYYTPAEVTIDAAGIKPDVEVPMNKTNQVALLKQMYKSTKDDSKLINEQNHGTVSGNQATEATVEDVQLKKAVQILEEDPVFDNLVAKYHKDTHETQVAASPDKVLKQGPTAEDDEPVTPENAEEQGPAPAPAPAPAPK